MSTEETTAVGAPAEPPRVEAPTPTLCAGDRLGRYVVDGVLGSGGMGVVYAALDPELDRRVALKVMRPRGAGSRADADAQTRLLREAQAMAGLSHPNVVRVFDVGVADERVYVAMELVQGRTLRQWLARPRPWRRVLEVMIAAGRGLQAAHAMGIVHRDFKPGNVLLADDPVDAHDSVRVLDFGLALEEDPLASSSHVDSVDSGSESRSSRQPRLTEVGMVIGTPTYMAPEQAAGDPVDARSDQFSFCVTLYEALYGETPFAGEKRAERLRNARRGRVRDAPPGTDVPDRLRRHVLRGLAPQPERRWPDLATLLDALERLVHPRSRTRLVIGGVAVLVASTAAAWVLHASPPCAEIDADLEATWNPRVRARVEEVFDTGRRPYAVASWQRVSERIDAFAEEWSALRTDVCEAGDVEPQIREAQVACLGRRRAELSALVDVLLDADEDVVRHAVQSADELGDPSECRETPTGVQPPSPAVAEHVQEIREQLASVAIYTASRRYERALEVGRAAVEAAAALDYAPLHAEALRRHGETRSEMGEYDVAAESLERAFYLAHEAGHDEEAALAAADLYFVLGYRKGDPETAEIWRGHAEAAVQRLGDAGAAANAKFVQVSGAVALRQADYVRARELLTEGRRLAIELHGEDHLHVATLSGNLGVAELNRGDFDAARRHFEAALAVTERNYGPDHPEIASWYNNLGVVEQTRGNHAASLEWFRKSYDVESAIFGDKHPGVALTLNNIGGALAYLERNEDARDYFERSIAAYEAAGDYDPIDLARPIGNLGRTLHHLGDAEGGAEQLRRSIQLIEEAAGPDHPELSTMCVNLGSIYQNAGRLHEALELMERAVAIDRTSLGARHPFVGSSLASIGEVYLALGRRAEAVANISAALDIQSDGEGDPENLAATKFLLARALWTDPAERTRARTLLADAERELQAIGPVAADRLTDLRTWMREHAGAHQSE